jgi:hypothetical protein
LGKSRTADNFHHFTLGRPLTLTENRPGDSTITINAAILAEFYQIDMARWASFDRLRDRVLYRA